MAEFSFVLRPLPSSKVNIPASPFAMWPVGLMDKASASGAGDWASHLFTWKAIWKAFGIIASAHGLGRIWVHDSYASQKIP